MSNVWVFATVLFCAAVAVRASIIPGRCPVVPVKEDFDVTKYVGQWYEIRKYLAIYQLGVNCSAATYALLGDGRVSVNNTGTAARFNGTRYAVNVTGVAYVPDKNVASKLKVYFPKLNVTGDYWVIATDYTGYSIVWACQNIAGGLFHQVQSWVLSRSPSPFNGDMEAVIDKELSSHNIDATLYRTEVQQNCLNY